MTVRRVQDPAHVSRASGGEQRCDGIELVQVVLPCREWTGPVRAAEVERFPVSAQIGAFRTVQVAKAHDAGRHWTRECDQFTFEDCLRQRAQGIIHAGSVCHTVHEGEACVDKDRGIARAGSANRAARSGQRFAGEILPGVPIVQQCVRLLPGNVDVDIPA